MDTRGSVSIVPPAGQAPLRSKSLRQQRASNGANIIKAYVLQSDQRREQAKFHASSTRHTTDGMHSSSRDERYELDHSAHIAPLSPQATVGSMVSLQPRTARNNQEPVGEGYALDALFAQRRMHRSRRPSIAVGGSATGRPVSPVHTGVVHDVQSGHTAIKPIMRRRLQMEIEASVNATNGTKDASGHHSYRSPVSTLTPHHPRVKHNLGAKLDALAKQSMHNRRKVVLASDDKTSRQPKAGSPRHTSPSTGAAPSTDSHTSNNGTGGHGANRGALKEPSDSEIESRVMTAFRQIVRLWRERKRRAEAVAVSKMNRNSNGIATGTGRNGSKLRKDLTAQSGNVVGILSRRLIREVPALKFFDDEDIPSAVPPTAPSSPSPVAHSRLPANGIPAIVKPERAKPRGVCYTLDAFGCRKIKMQSSTSSAKAASASHRGQSNGGGKPEELTLEKAMSRSLRRKMARRIRFRRQNLMRLSDEFSKSRRDLATKLRTQLALQRAQIEKMFTKRLALLTTDDTNLPPYMAQKELHLARLRCKKANLLEKCETLRVLALALKQVEAAGDASGVEVTTGELHFLDLFRCVVEENQVLTPIISSAIRQHMRSHDLQQPMIMELFHTLDREIHKGNTGQELS